jgi:hypothetical protein
MKARKNEFFYMFLTMYLYKVLLTNLSLLELVDNGH